MGLANTLARAGIKILFPRTEKLSELKSPGAMLCEVLHYDVGTMSHQFHSLKALCHSVGPWLD